MRDLDILGTEELFVVIFLLCCFEIVAQQETMSSTLKQIGELFIARESRTEEKPWTPMVQRIIIWLYLFHAKALHLGGRGLLSRNVLKLIHDQQNQAVYLGNIYYDRNDISNLIVWTLQQSLFQFYYELQ